MTTDEPLVRVAQEPRRATRCGSADRHPVARRLNASGRQAAYAIAEPGLHITAFRSTVPVCIGSGSTPSHRVRGRPRSA
jgi:hypothetical protein